MNDITHVLGKTTEYKEFYNPDILAREPRSRNRESYNITDECFFGYDVWHDYEASFLLSNGSPVQGILKMIVPSNSLYIVESKSLKLYLFSFMMEKLGDTEDSAITTYVETVSRDISNLLECKIQLKFFKLADMTSLTVDLSDWTNIDNNIDTSTYCEDPSILSPSTRKRLKVFSHALRSRCKITSQPDWGTVFIEMEGSSVPSVDSLYRYIISFRNENHFHEEIVEVIFKRLLDIFNPSSLVVTAFYTRRGGIDINPVRSLQPTFTSPFNIADIDSINYRMIRS